MNGLVGLGHIKSHLRMMRSVILAAGEFGRDGIRSGWVHDTEVRHSPTRGGQNHGIFAKAEFAGDAEAFESWSGETLSDEGDTAQFGVGAVVNWRVRGEIRGAG